MTFLDAAEAILREEKRPLHFRELARLAIEGGLIESKGKTPDATMGAVLYQQVKRAAGSGEPSRFRSAGRGKFGVRRRTVPLHELTLGDLIVDADDDEGSAEKSATLWPLPGGQDSHFESLLAFFDKLAADTPTVDEMTDWVFKNFEKVTKQTVVQSCHRAVLYSMGLIEFDGERVALSDSGEQLQRDRTKSALLTWAVTSSGAKNV